VYASAKLRKPARVFILFLGVCSLNRLFGLFFRHVHRGIASEKPTGDEFEAAL